ncbi:MAG: MarR family transcriptional regulator [Candidatus Thiodiazotropha sp. (ex Troendleina suluensis)]|nr:MarR family transcriptional regulator [Candidatus Thiodiazotropha sp. (ex Troendleina suluensis)]
MIIDFAQYRHLGLMDMESGDFIGEFTFSGDKIPKEGEWVRLYQRAAAKLARNPNMTLGAFRVYLYFLGKIAYSNAERITQKEVANTCGMAMRTAHSSINLLVKEGVLVRHESKDHLYFYRLNPNYAWNGKLNARNLAIVFNS